MRVEFLRIDAYFSYRDIKRLKLLVEDYVFWKMAAPVEYRQDWENSLRYCEEKILEIDPRYLRKSA